MRVCRVCSCARLVWADVLFRCCFCVIKIPVVKSGVNALIDTDKNSKNISKYSRNRQNAEYYSRHNSVKRNIITNKTVRNRLSDSFYFLAKRDLFCQTAQKFARNAFVTEGYQCEICVNIPRTKFLVLQGFCFPVGIFALAKRPFLRQFRPESYHGSSGR